jgi:hypothetical protein
MQMMPKMSWPQRVAGEAMASERTAVDAVVMCSFPTIFLFVHPGLSAEFTILASFVNRLNGATSSHGSGSTRYVCDAAFEQN